MSVPASSVDESVLDGYRALQEEGQPDVVTEFIDVFLEDLPDRVANIRNSVLENNPKNLRAAGHALKGSASTIGAMRLSELSSQLEAIGRTESTTGASPILAELESEVVAVKNALLGFRRP